jgi:hypothetical protein
VNPEELEGMDSKAAEGGGGKVLSAVLYPFPRKCLQGLSRTRKEREKKSKGKFQYLYKWENLFTVHK